MRPSSSARVACIASPRSGFNRFYQKTGILCIISHLVFQRNDHQSYSSIRHDADDRSSVLKGTTWEGTGLRRAQALGGHRPWRAQAFGGHRPWEGRALGGHRPWEGRALGWSGVEGYGLQPVHKAHRISGALAPEGALSAAASQGFRSSAETRKSFPNRSTSASSSRIGFASPRNAGAASEPRTCGEQKAVRRSTSPPASSAVFTRVPVSVSSVRIPSAPSLSSTFPSGTRPFSASSTCTRTPAKSAPQSAAHSTPWPAPAEQP